VIIVEGWVRAAPAAIDQVLPAIKTVIEASRAEPGCHEYAIARDLLDPGLLRLAERWRDEAALTAHFQTPHVAAFSAVLASVQMEAASVQMYAGEHVRALIQRP
jgi:quinol monooxygenase YgiN